MPVPVPVSPFGYGGGFGYNPFFHPFGGFGFNPFFSPFGLFRVSPLDLLLVGGVVWAGSQVVRRVEDGGSPFFSQMNDDAYYSPTLGNGASVVKLQLGMDSQWGGVEREGERSIMESLRIATEEADTETSEGVIRRRRRRRREE